MINKKILTLVSLLLISFLMVGCFIARNEAPVIISDPTTVATVGVEYTYDVNATDLEEDVLTYSLVTKPTGMTINPTTGLISWTPTGGQVGHHDVIVGVSDGWNEITQTFGIVVVVKPVELTKIVVDPKTMILLLPGGSQPFNVTAYYNDGTNEKIGSLDYSYDVNPTGIVIVWPNAPENRNWVTAVAEGTATITVSYGDKSDSLEVTVTYLSMEIIADMPTFTVDATSDFKVEIVANSDVGKNVMFYFTLPTWPPGNSVIYYDDITEGWLPLEAGGTYIFGGKGFPLNDGVILFQGVFSAVGTYSTTVEVWEVTGNYPNEDRIDLLCNKDISAVVK